MGREANPSNPKITIIIDITVDNTGFSINFLNMIFYFFEEEIAAIFTPSLKFPIPSVTITSPAFTPSVMR